MPPRKSKYANVNLFEIADAKKSKKSTAKSGSTYKTRAPRDPFPMIKNFIFNYSQDIDLLPSGSGAATNIWRANGLRDPDQTGVGGQPRYFDTMVSGNDGVGPYRQYAVYGCKATVFARNQSAVHLFVAVTICPSSTTSPSTLAEARERGDTVMRILPPIGSGTATCKVSMYRSMAKVLGLKDVMDDDRAKGDVTNNPSNPAVVYTTTFNPDGSVAARVGMNVSLRYYCKLFQKNDVAQS